jgi:hypothetical protein
LFNTRNTFESDITDIANTNCPNAQDKQSHQSIVGYRPSESISKIHYKSTNPVKNSKYNYHELSSDYSSLQTISKISVAPEVLQKVKWDKVSKTPKHS